MSTAERRRPEHDSLQRLPDEVQALIGARVLAEIPEGPIRDSVEGYLAVPEDQRGPHSMAQRILTSAVRRAQAMARQPYRPIDAYFDSAETAANQAIRRRTAETEPDQDAPGPSVEAVEVEGSEAPEASTEARTWSSPPRAHGFPRPPGLAAPAADEPHGHAPPDRPEPEPPSASPRARSRYGGSRRGLRFEFVEPRAEAPAAGTEAPPVAPAPERRAASPTPAAGAETRPDPTRRSPAAYDLQAARRELLASPPGWRSGYPELDGSGFRLLAGHLYMVHAPRGGGKTALLLEFVRRHLSLRAAAKGDFRPALLLSCGESRAQTYARLLIHAAQHREGADGLISAPSAPAVLEWVRSGLASSPDLASALEAAARTVDASMAEGRLALADGKNDLGIDTVVGWFDHARVDASRAPSMVVVDDAHLLERPAGRRSGSPEQQRLAIVRGLRAIADGGHQGPRCAVPVIFSLPTASAESLPAIERASAEALAAEATAILRVDQVGGRPTVMVEKNTGGPRGWMFPIELYAAWGRGEAALRD